MAVERIAPSQTFQVETQPSVPERKGVEECREALKKSGHGQLAILLDEHEQNNLFFFAQGCAKREKPFYHISGVKVTPTGQIRPLIDNYGNITLAGKGAQLVYQALSQEAEFILSGGSAMENVGGKGNLRPNTTTFDADIFMVSKTGQSIDLKAAYRAVSRIAQKDGPCFVRMKSWWMPGWTRLEMDGSPPGKPKQRDSLGHFTLTRFGADLGGNYYLVQHATTWGSATRYQYYFFDENDTLQAVELDFYPQHRKFVNIPAQTLGIFKAMPGQEAYIANIDHFPQFTFGLEDENDYVNAFFIACHQARRAAGGNFINFYLENPENEAVFLNPEEHTEEIQELAWKSAAYVARKIMYPIAENPELIVYNQISAYKAVKLIWETQEASLRANPLWGWRCLQSPEDFGVGIIDPRGPLADQAMFLDEGNRRERLEMVLQKQNTGPQGTGYTAYLKFLLSECRGDQRAVASLMIPRKLQPLVDPYAAVDFMRRRLNPHS